MHNIYMYHGLELTVINTVYYAILITLIPLSMIINM